MKNKSPIEREIEIRQELLRRKRRRKLFDLFPDTGPLRRELYTKQMSFFEAGAQYKERAFIAGNRTGKTLCASYETALHLTGRYPAWWVGRRFDRPVLIWAAGEDAKTVRETLQVTLMGAYEDVGTGLIPGDEVVNFTTRSGVSEAVDAVTVKHISGGKSRLVFKTYDQGREAFQGAAVDVVWFDEEPPQAVYMEGLTRTMSTVPGQPNGLTICTFTPLKGLSGVVLLYLPGGRPAKDSDSRRFVVMAGWEDVPHLDAAAKKELLDAILPYQRDSRTKGIPQLGAGAIYPIAEEEFVIEPFRFPVWYRHVYGLDIGWNKTAALWAALDPETDVAYLYSEYYQAEAIPVVHAESIKARGAWIPGVIDPASRGRGQHDGEQMLGQYRAHLKGLTCADNAIESGIYEVWSRLTTGRLKCFSTLPNFLGEFRIYRRSEQGKIVKENDHLMDCTRYLCISGLARAAQRPSDEWAKMVKRSAHQFDYEPYAEAFKIQGA